MPGGALCRKDGMAFTGAGGNAGSWFWRHAQESGTTGMQVGRKACEHRKPALERRSALGAPGLRAGRPAVRRPHGILRWDSWVPGRLRRILVNQPPRPGAWRDADPAYTGEPRRTQAITDAIHMPGWQESAASQSERTNFSPFGVLGTYSSPSPVLRRILRRVSLVIPSSRQAALRLP